jgi:hypothetical protein
VFASQANEGLAAQAGTLRAIELEDTRRGAEVELVHAPLAELAAELYLVPAGDVGQCVGQVPGNVLTAFGRRDAHLIETADLDVGSSHHRLPANQSTRAQVKPETLHIEAVVGVVEDLIEIANTGEQLVGQLIGKHRTQHGGVVLHMQRSHFKVITQVGTRRSQRQTRARRLCLAALSAKPMDRQTLFVGEVNVYLRHTVIAIACTRYRSEVVVRGGRKVCDGTGPQGRKQPGG